MLSSGPEKAGLARDTVFAAVMIICNGIVGVCLFVGGLHHREQAFQAPGANAAMAILVALLGLTMVLPNFTSSTPGPAVPVATRLRGRHVAGALRQLRVRADGAASRLLLVGSSDENEHAPPPPVR
jgi:Ca2+:H+ antiporter